MPISRDGIILELLGEVNGFDILDTSGAENHAYMSEPVAVEQNGHPLGAAFVFDGSNYALLPHSTLVQGAAPRTVAMWVYRASRIFGGQYETIYNTGFRQTRRWFNITLGPGTLEFLNYGYGSENSTVRFDYGGAWHFVCFQYDGTYKRAWINDDKVVEQSIDLNTGSDYNEIAQREGNYRFQGKLARIRLWDRALSDTEVSAVYRESVSIRESLRSLNVLGPSRAHQTIAPGLGAGHHGLTTHSSIGLETRSHNSGSLGSNRHGGAIFGLGWGNVPTPALHSLGEQSLRPEPALLGRIAHIRNTIPIAGKGARTIFRHGVSLTGTARTFGISQSSTTARTSGFFVRSVLDIADPLIHRRSHSIRVFLAGDEVTAAVLDCAMRSGLDTPHNEVALVIGHGKPRIDAILKKHLPVESRDTPRLKISIDGVDHVFLLEEREQHARTTRLGGRSLSAWAELPYANSITVEGGVKASKAAQLLANPCGLNIIWNAHDWRLPDSWISSGTPMENLQSLARAVGAFLRWDHLQQALTVTHADSATRSSTILDYSACPVLAATNASEQGTGCNALTVQGHANEIRLPQLEVEPPPEDLSAHQRGAPTTVLAHWPAGRSSASWTWASHGNVESLGERIVWRKRALISFIMGSAELQEAAVQLENVEWIGASAGRVRLNPGTTQLLCEPGRSGVACVDYAIRVQRFLLTGHDVPALVFLVAASTPDRTGVRVIHGDCAIREEDAPLEEPLLTDHAGAVARGRSHLAWNSRPRRVWTVTVPYMPDATPGACILLDHGELDIAGPCLIRAVRLEAHGPKLVHHLEIIQWTD